MTSSKNTPEPVSQKETYIDIMNDSNDSYKKEARRAIAQNSCGNVIIWRTWTQSMSI